MTEKKIQQNHKDFILHHGADVKKTAKEIAVLFEKEFGFSLSPVTINFTIRKQKTLEREMLIEAYKDRAAFTSQFMQGIAEETIERVFNIMKEYTDPECSMNEKRMGLEASKVLHTLIQGQLELTMGKTEAKIDSGAILDKLLLKISGGKVLSAEQALDKEQVSSNTPNPFILTEGNIIDVDDASDPFEDEEAVEQDDTIWEKDLTWNTSDDDRIYEKMSTNFKKVRKL
jgi:hypothetical protein